MAPCRFDAELVLFWLRSLPHPSPALLCTTEGLIIAGCVSWSLRTGGLAVLVPGGQAMRGE